MKTKLLEKIYAVLLLAIFGGIVIHAPLSVYFGSLFPQFELLIKSWKEILMFVALVIGVVLVTRRRLWRELFSDWIIRLIAAFAALHLLTVAIIYNGAEATAAGLMIDLRFVLYFALVYVLLKLAPEWRRWMLRVGIVGAFVVVGFGTLQYFLPADVLTHIGYNETTIQPYLTVDKNPDYVRINSTLRGPNPLGAYAGIVLGLLAAALARGKVALRSKEMGAAIVLAICSVVSLWLSYSRSAGFVALVIVAVVALATYGRKLSRTVWITVVAAVFALGGGLFLARDNSFVSNVILHENPNGGSAISSNEAHVTSLQRDIGRLVEQPLGAGVGSSGSASLYTDHQTTIENAYLFVAHEVGWLGLILFMGLFVFILVRLWHRRADWLALGTFASGIGLALIGLLLPVWADDTISIVWWGLAAIILGGKNDR